MAGGSRVVYVMLDKWGRMTGPDYTCAKDAEKALERTSLRINTYGWKIERIELG